MRLFAKLLFKNETAGVRNLRLPFIDDGGHVQRGIKRFNKMTQPIERHDI